MNVKYSFFKCSISATGLCAALLLGVACTDDFGYHNREGKQIAFDVIAPDTWHDGMDINENEPSTRCLSVEELDSDGDTKLYLHTVVADNPVVETVGATRGTPIGDLNTFKNKYTRFSLSGICYTGAYPEDESHNEWTPEYAYDLPYSTASGTAAEGGRPLIWPSNGKVRFFAFAPTLKDFEDLNTDGSLTLSQATDAGSPKLTYTVPADVTEQIDLMTAQTDVRAAITPQVELKFGHALTAVRIVCGKDMLAGKISKVEISGVYGSGSQVIGSETWTPSGEHTASYTISKEIVLPTDNDSDDTIHAGNGTAIAGTETDNLTFMLMPQTLPEGAKITIVFTDDASGTERTISGSIAGQTWDVGKIITYSVSPSSIHINASIDIGKKGADDANPDGDVIPYSGVWYDVKYTAKVEIVQAGVDTKEIVDIPVNDISFQYQLDGSESWSACTTDAGGLLQIAPQPAYATMRAPFGNKTETESGSESNPESLTVNGKTANCYMVDKAGYFKLPLVYGNGNVAVPVEHVKSLKYYVDHNDQQITSPTITGAYDAVLCWQDAPDLIDPASVKVVGTDLVFRIRKQTLTQGNALLAVRNAAKEIIWSWHIWVTPYKADFYNENNFYTSKPDATYSYDLAIYNLGWCDAHDHNPKRKFKLRAVVDMSAYGGKKQTPVEIGTFTQDVFKGSDGGDNTYYQWGRKDPMLGGIYNSYTPEYTYLKKGTSEDKYEFTMENKQVFNQYNKEGYNYSFCKNPGDMVEPSGEASKGVTIGYAIRHPYMFVTNSKEYIKPGDNEPSDYNPETGKGYNPLTGDGFNFRNHWHIPYVINQVSYLNQDEHIMFNAWNSAATDAGYEYGNTGTLANNAEYVTKSVYDPCPPDFQVPPIHALKGIYDKPISAWSYDDVDNAWTITSDGKSITFPMTGVRNYALRPTEWTTVDLTGSGLTYTEFYKISMPAFRMLTFVTSATIVKKEVYNAYQVYIFRIDRTERGNPAGPSNLTKARTPSSNSYGLSVRAMYYAESVY